MGFFNIFTSKFKDIDKDGFADGIDLNFDFRGNGVQESVSQMTDGKYNTVSDLADAASEAAGETVDTVEGIIDFLSSLFG